LSDLTFAAVDLGGTKIAAAIGRADGTLVAQSAIATDSHEGAEAVLARMASLVRDLAALSGAAPAALGLGVPGLVDVATGTTRFLPNMTGEWRDVPVRKLLEPQVDCPVALLNDARLATLGELTYGHGRTARTLVCLTLGTGIGGGVAIDGVLRLGTLGSAGEIGHQTIVPDGPLCTCGNRGCLEALASGPAIAARGMYLLQCGRAPILREIVGGDIGAVTPREMALAAERGEKVVRAELVRAFEYLGIGIANAITTLHPDMVVLGGGLAEIGPLLFETVTKVVLKRVRMFPAGGVRIEKSLVGDNAALLGGLALAAQTAVERGTLHREP
jgi:glucokinase